jgi:hypothetical protein
LHAVVLHTCRLAVCYLCIYASLCFIVQAIASLLFSWNTSRGWWARPALDYNCGNTLKTALTNAPGDCTAGVRLPETLPFECGFTAGDARGLARPFLCASPLFFLCVTQVCAASVWVLPTWMGKVCRSFCTRFTEAACLALLCCLPTARMMVLGMVD